MSNLISLSDIFTKKYKGITANSGDVKPGFIFFALKGLHSDGHDYINQAVNNGAVVIVGEKNIQNLPVDYCRVENSRETLGIVASSFYGNPSGKLKIIGVTGTKGKTTTCHLIYHLLTRLGNKTGIISTLSTPGLHVTSPDVIYLHKTLKEFVDKGYKYAIIEVSSHGIDQKRIAGVNFEVGVLTNLAPEHLDYHKTFSEYKKIKMSFINKCNQKVIWPKETDINILPGKYNNLDAECAVEALEKLGISRVDLIKEIPSFELPEGRLMNVKNDLDINIVIDFAHTPDSLKAVLKHLKTETKGKLISVFGCAGERDTRKRFQMGKISVSIADCSIFTAEDPRSENIFKILSKMRDGAIKSGGVEGKNFVRIAQRGEAITHALSIAKKGDTVAILGKGHEKSMAYDTYEHPWNDLQFINNLLDTDKNISAVVLAAGKGSRMKSFLPKVLHKICGKPMVTYTLENLRKAGIMDIVSVVSFKRNLVKKAIMGACKIAIQKNPKGGTADAAKTGFNLISNDSKTLIVINGDDSAFYKPETIKNIVKTHLDRNRKLTFVSLIKNNPTGLGRVIRGKNGLITKVVEEKEATEEEKRINEVNDGLYVFDRNWFSRNIKKVNKSASGELYLVDLIKIAIEQGDRMATYTLPNDDEWQGINTPEELQKAIIKMEARLK